MIFLVLTKEGLNKSIEMRKYFDLHVWCGSDVILNSDALKNGVSQFNYPLKGEGQEILMDALSTMKEHHPGKIIWVENLGASPYEMDTTR